jgi:hypothetical protein
MSVEKFFEIIQEKLGYSIARKHLPKFQKVWNYLVENFNANQAVYLGHGTQGIAIQIADDVVCKVSRDRSEACAMNVVAKTPSNVVARVFDVFEMERLNLTDDSLDIYYIVQEKLEKIEPNWQDCADGYSSEYEINLYTYDRHYEENLNAVGGNTEFMDWMRLVATYLSSVRIEWMDIHKGNVMKRPNGEHVIIDLGYSYSPELWKQQIPKVA